MLKKSGQISIFGQISIDPFLITFNLYRNPIIITPKHFNKTVLDEDVHVVQHISFIFVGLIGFFLLIRSLGESYQIFLILIL